MPTNREVDAKREARQRREKRYYSDDRLGPPCADARCHLRLDKKLSDQGDRTHATCGREARELARLSRVAPTREALTGEPVVVDDTRRPTRTVTVDERLETAKGSRHDDVPTSPPDDTLPCG